MAWDRKIPFDPHTGDMQHYAEPKYRALDECRTCGNSQALCRCVRDLKSNSYGFSARYESLEPNWIDAHEFDATLVLVDYSRGRSAAYFWLSDGKKKYPIFMKDFFDVAQRCNMVGGQIEHQRWKMKKQGENYGIALVKLPPSFADKEEENADRD